MIDVEPDRAPRMRPIYSDYEVADFEGWCGTVPVAQARARLASARRLHMLTDAQAGRISRAIERHERTLTQ